MVSDLDSDATAFGANPAQFLDHSRYASQHLDVQYLADLQLTALRQRFENLSGRIPVLTNMIHDQGTTEITTLDDVVPLLFPHSVYKSYPQALIQNERFDQLTRWLGRLTTVDLSGVDAGSCSDIDSWLDLLDEHTELRVVHSTGTTGTLSFLPRTAGEYDRMVENMRPGLFQYSDPLDQRDHDEEWFDVIWPTFRHGRSAFMRGADLFMKHYAGSQDRFHALYDHPLSADAMALAGRLRVAAARGESVTISPALQARREEFEQVQREMAEAMPRFFTEVSETLKGERVWIFGTWNLMFDMARGGLERGITGLFSPESVATTGGGAKGSVVDDDWQKQVMLFAGVSRIQHVYGMTELMAMNKACTHGRYHMEPWVLLYVLDADTGELLPRTGVQRGRAAFFDLMAETYWGGTITGDEVCADYGPCPCGQTTAHVGMKIERFSVSRGGEDKISCAGADDAHRSAVDFLTSGLT